MDSSADWRPHRTVEGSKDKRDRAVVNTIFGPGQAEERPLIPLVLIPQRCHEIKGSFKSVKESVFSNKLRSVIPPGMTHVSIFVI